MKRMSQYDLWAWLKVEIALGKSKSFLFYFILLVSMLQPYHKHVQYNIGATIGG